MDRFRRFGKLFSIGQKFWKARDFKFSVVSFLVYYFAVCYQYGSISDYLSSKWSQNQFKMMFFGTIRDCILAKSCFITAGYIMKHDGEL